MFLQYITKLAYILRFIYYNMYFVKLDLKMTFCNYNYFWLLFDSLCRVYYKKLQIMALPIVVPSCSHGWTSKCTLLLIQGCTCICTSWLAIVLPILVCTQLLSHGCPYRSTLLLCFCLLLLLCKLLFSHGSTQFNNLTTCLQMLN